MNQRYTPKPEISVAPMMDWTDRHCRYFHRLIAPHVKLYTEMVTTGALLHGDRDRFLKFDEAEHPVALQLGGSDPEELAFCARAGEAAGYDEINLNCGCPSDRVQAGRFGACLMKEPAHVGTCVKAMLEAVQVPVTVKCRIGVDEQDDFSFLEAFVDKIVESGCTTFIIHARKAWLKGLSPKENREKPPLNYERVQAVKEKYPGLRIILNGGITTLEQARTQVKTLDGVMIGREAYQNPYFLSEIERGVFGAQFSKSRETIALAMMDYARTQRKLYDTPIKSITRHILGLYHEQQRAKIWRRTLSTLPYEDGADESVILRALELMEEKKMAA
ncbi:MAG: tRNA dihydrouridine(20/20a) synthase DusA [Alphaproteobacteria bacterium]|nr:tRNA dihydrouridine(20/20a) synthase DusA [Alphaproteobacteria bacterium]